MVQVSEEEEQHHDLHGPEEAEGEVLGVDESDGEVVYRRVAQVEHVGGPVDGQDHRRGTQRGQHHAVHQPEEPRAGDGCLLVEVASFLVVAIVAQHRRDAGDGEDAGHLHGPPDEHLHGQQRIAQHRCHHAGDEHGEQDIGVEHVAARHLTVVSPDGRPLPQGAGQQDGREDEVHQVVGDEHDAEDNHDEADGHDGRIDAEPLHDLPAVEADEQRQQDDPHEPSIFYQQSAGHDDEVLRPHEPHQPEDDGEGDDRGGHDDTHALVLERLFGVVAFLALADPVEQEVELVVPHQPGEEKADEEIVECHGQRPSDDQHHEQSEDDAAVPVGAGPFDGPVLVSHRLGRLRHLPSQAGEDGEVVVAAVAEDRVLYARVALVGIVVEILELRLGVPVHLHILLHLRAVLVERAPDVDGQCETHVAVYLGLLGQCSHIHLAEVVDEAVVAVHLNVGIVDISLERTGVDLEPAVLLGGLVAGIGQVEDVAAALRVEHQGVLLALVEHRHDV